MIKDFVIGEGALPVDGEANGANVAARDNLYLLDGMGTVLLASEVRALVPEGKNLFAELGTAAPELNALRRTLAEGEDTMYLMQCGAVPVLLVRYLWRGNRTLLAVIPDKDLAQALRRPAAYAGVLFAGELAFSPLSASKSMPADERVYRAAQEWISPYRALRAASEEHAVGVRDLLSFLVSRTVRLAEVCGVRALYYYSGIGYATVCNINYPLLMASLSAAMMAVRCLAKEKTAYFSIEREGDKDPLIYVRLYPEGEGEQAALHQLPHSISAQEGELLCFSHPSIAGASNIRFSICQKPLEALEVRNRFFR